MKNLWITITVIVALLMSACSDNGNPKQYQEADKLMEKAHKARDYNRLMALADSLDETGGLSHAKADYWRGYASDRMKKLRMAEFYWKTSMQEAEAHNDELNNDVYAKSASRLANLLTIRGDYESGLKMAVPAANRLEELKCDTTSDYVNLLIYIGCCQAGLNKAGEESRDGFDRAYQKHLDNIEKNHTDASYKNAIAGLINIAVACITTENYRDALRWTDHFGKLLQEYEQRPDANTDYIDKQLARFDIYQAQALVGQGNLEEAAKIYEKFRTTKFSNTPEGRIIANDYLIAAKRWDEAADNYKSLDEMLGSDGKSYTTEDIRNLVLKKYHTNMLAGRRDSAINVSLKISDALDEAFAQAKQLDAEEQATIVGKVEQIGEQQAERVRNKQIELLGIIGLLFLICILWTIYRRRHAQKIREAYDTLKEECAQLESDTEQKTRKATEESIAHDIQQTVGRDALPELEKLGIFTSHAPGKLSGNGLFDIRLVDDKVVFCIGNASQNGAKASAATAMIWAQFRVATAFESTPEKIMKAINETYTKTAEDGLTVRLFIGTLDKKTGQLLYCNAGDHAPLLLMNQEVGLLSIEENAPIGTNPGYQYPLQETTLAPKTLLLLYSDGITEAVNETERSYGEKQLRGAALQAIKRDDSPRMFFQHLCEDFHKFIGERKQEKDQTLIVIGR